jgi:hypothetical protein
MHPSQAEDDMAKRSERQSVVRSRVERDEASGTDRVVRAVEENNSALPRG